MSVTIKGLDKVLKDIESRGNKVQKAVVTVLSETAQAIEFDAKAACPPDILGVAISTKGRITSKFEKGGLYWNVGINATEDLDAYVEFSTGLDAARVLNGVGYTQEMRDIAIRFKKTGLGTLRGTPFLFPAYIKNTANLVEEIEKEIAQQIK
jgi:hypothetical protein